MTRKLALSFALLMPVPAAAATPPIPITVIQPATPQPLEIYAVSVRPGANGIHVSGRVRRPMANHGHIAGHIVATATLRADGDPAGVRQFEGIAPWPRMSNRGPRAGAFHIFVPVPVSVPVSGGQPRNPGVTVSFRSSR